jgi:hypothetical protein
VREILPGLFHWTAFHPRIREQVSSYYHAQSGTLIDPMLPEEGLEWFQGRGPKRILLTNRHHYRHCDRFVAAFNMPVACHESGLHEFERGPDVEGFSFGDELAPGILALEVDSICPDDTAFHLDVAEGALAFADAIIRYGKLGFVPDRYMDGPDAVKAGVREAAHRLLDHRFDTLLFAHGEPLVGGGKDALREFATSA